jgi:hypothetical protein
MTSYRGRTPAAPVSTARHLGRLHQDLSDLGRRLREAIALAVGRAASDVVIEAVCHALAGVDTFCPPPYGPARWPDLHRDSWYGHEEPAWSPGAGYPDEVAPHGRDPYRGGELFGADPDETPGPEGAPRAGAWVLGLAAGLEVAAWCLRNVPGLTPSQAALAAALVAVAAALLGGESVLAAVGLAAAAVRLLALAAAARSGAAALRRPAAGGPEEPARP